MNAHLRRAAVALAAVSMTAGLAACGSAKEAGGGTAKKDKKGPLTIGLLLPENQTARYERFDRPLIEKELKELAAPTPSSSTTTPSRTPPSSSSRSTR